MADPVFVDGVTPLNAVNMTKLQTRDEKGQPGGYASLDGTGKVPAAQLSSAGLVISTKAGDYTLALADANTLVEMNVAAANIVTVPANATAAFPVGTTISIAQLGPGQTSLVAAGGVVLRAYNGNQKLAGSGAVCSIIKRATDDWWVAGNLVP